MRKLTILFTVLVVAAGLVFTYPVLGGNIPPVANFEYFPPNPLIGQAVTFDATPSYDPDGYIKDYAWDFTCDNIPDRTGRTTTWTFSKSGTFFATLFVIDNAGRTSSLTRRIEIAAAPLSFPVAHFAWITEYQTVWFISLSLTKEIVRYEWDFGDGQRLVTDQARISHFYQFGGKYTVTLTITDKLGGIDSKSYLVIVPPCPKRLLMLTITPETKAAMVVILVFVINIALITLLVLK